MRRRRGWGSWFQVASLHYFFRCEIASDGNALPFVIACGGETVGIQWCSVMVSITLTVLLTGYMDAIDSPVDS
jgi:hypothetical protein